MMIIEQFKPGKAIQANITSRHISKDETWQD
jgi:hypothetical protein